MEELGTLAAHDAVLNLTYSFTVYREADSPDVRIRSTQTAGAVFEPQQIAARCRAALAQDQAYFLWGYSFEPSTDDPRQIEFRVYPNADSTADLELFVVTRAADGSAQPPQILRLDNFLGAAPERGPLLEVPASNDYRRYTTLGYCDAYDAVLDMDYAFLVYEETEVESGAWQVRVQSSQTAGGSFDPSAIRNAARAAESQGKAYFTWGYSFEPSADDPRQIEFRVHQQDGEPVALEVFVVTRNADGSPKAPVTVRCPWPLE